jgi:hypothetical protein
MPQFVMPIFEKWDTDTIVGRINLLRKDIQWKNFKLTYDELTQSKKGYFAINFSYGSPEQKGAIHIWRDKVEITTKNWRETLIAEVLLSFLLVEDKSSIFLDSLLRGFKENKEFNRQFQEMSLHILISQYLDLVNDQVPRELLQNTKEMVIIQLESMLNEVKSLE